MAENDWWCAAAVDLVEVRGSCACSLVEGSNLWTDDLVRRALGTQAFLGWGLWDNYLSLTFALRCRFQNE